MHQIYCFSSSKTFEKLKHFSKFKLMLVYHNRLGGMYLSMYIHIVGFLDTRFCSMYLTKYQDLKVLQTNAYSIMK